MTKYEKALLDIIAYAEGTIGLSNNGYDVTVGHYVINGWTEDTDIVHLNKEWEIYIERLNIYATAAGRYQFKYATWIGNWIGGTKTKSGQNVPMTKNNQDAAALHQIYIKREVSKSDVAGMENIATFAKVINKLASEWASLPTSSGSGYYEGQGGDEDKTVGKLHEIFMIALARY